MARILGIGTATVDVINAVDGYPREDEEVRARSQRIARGGNAANTLLVLSEQGHACAWTGVLAREPDAERITDDFQRHGIDYSNCKWIDAGKVPVSYVTLNVRNGSRTIVHYRDLPELDAAHFLGIDCATYDWIHFEARNPDETARMLDHARRSAPHAILSLEAEKPRAAIEALLPLADVVMVSRAHARHSGYQSAPAFLRAMRAKTDADLVCGWGEQGAYGLDREGREIAVPAYPPAQVIDTLGAGDTLNAGVITARLRGLDWVDALDAASRLAGAACGQVGLEGLPPAP